MTTVTVKTTVGGFIEWLNSHGEANQPDFKPSGKPVKSLGPDSPLTIHHLVTTQHGIAGFIIVDIWPREAERLEVTLTAMREIDVIGRLTPGKPNPYATQLDAYLEQLVKAIKKRWADAAEEVQAPIPDNLSPRLKEVAHLVARGLGDKEIADVLLLSPNTIPGFRKDIKQHWGLETQHLRLMAIEARRRGYGGAKNTPESTPD